VKIPVLFIVLSFFHITCSSSDWITYRGKDNTFTIKFPGQPKEMNLKSGFGIDSTKILTYMDMTEEYNYNLTIMYPSEEILKPQFNDEQRFEILKKYSTITIDLIGKIVNTERIFLSGYPGIFVTGEIAQAVNEGPYPPLFVKSYLVKNRIYILRVSCSFKNRESKGKDVFFDSFELIQ